MSKVTIECSEKTAWLIERALELYSRIGLCQFESMDMVNSLHKEIFKDSALRSDFEQKCKELKTLFGLSPNAYWGIFNKEHVHDDVREAFHLYQVMRHDRYLHRINTGEQSERHYTVDEYPADICQMAGMEIPDFKTKIEKLKNEDN